MQGDDELPAISYEPDPARPDGLTNSERQEKVIKLYLQGFDILQIGEKTSIPFPVIRAIVSKAALRETRDEIAEKMEEETAKVVLPRAKRIRKIASQIVEEKLQHILSTGAHLAMSAAELKTIHDIGERAFNISRLEEGRSTSNVEVIQRVRAEIPTILQNLEKIDPFKTYPSLPAPDEKPVGE